MKKYHEKKRELEVLIKSKVEKITAQLVQKNEGKSISDLRRSTLNHIRENEVPEDVAVVLKSEIESFIGDIIIPTQE